MFTNFLSLHPPKKLKIYFLGFLLQISILHQHSFVYGPENFFQITVCKIVLLHGSSFTDCFIY